MRSMGTCAAAAATRASWQRFAGLRELRQRLRKEAAMPDEILVDECFEPERYELREAPAYAFAPSRREFIEIAGAGLLITVMAPPARAQQRRGRGGEDFFGSGARTLEARLHLATDGTVTLLSRKVQ